MNTPEQQMKQDWWEMCYYIFMVALNAMNLALTKHAVAGAINLFLIICFLIGLLACDGFRFWLCLFVRSVMGRI